MRAWAGALVACVLTLGACSDDGPAVLQELDATVGGMPVHVTYDAASRVCSTVRNGAAICQSVPLHRDATLDVQLDPVDGGTYALRMLVQSGTTFEAMPAVVMQMSVGLDTDLVMALFDSAPACFRQIDPDGQTHDVTVNATQVDTGTGVTAVASTEVAC